MQSVLVYIFGILVFTIHYFIGHAQLRSFEKGHFERSISLNNLNFYWSLVVTYIFPVLFFSYVWITVWYCGYMPSATGRMKQLVRPFDSVMQLCIDRCALITQRLFLNMYTQRKPISIYIFLGLVLPPYLRRILCYLVTRNVSTSRWSSETL